MKNIVSLFALPVALALGLGAYADPCLPPAALPPGFVHETLVVFPEATVNVVRALPDGRLVIGLGDGRAYIMSNTGAINTAAPFVDYETVPYEFNGSTVSHEAEGGVLGCAVSPDFATDHTIYLFSTTKRTDPGGRKFVLSSFELQPTGFDIVPGSETVIWQHTDENQSTDFHSGGGLIVGEDGMLYLSIGDDGNVSFPQSLASWRGKVLRMTTTGEAPTDNPFYQVGSAGAQNFVYARGLRNPFRLTKDPLRAGRVLLAETGQSLWDELNLALPGANYGWTLIEGPLADSPGVVPPSGYVDPFFAYPHGSGAIEGIAIVGAAVCDSAMFPASYQGDYFITEWGFFGKPAKIFHVDVDGNGDLVDVSVFHSSTVFGFGDIDFDSDGALVYSKANFVANPAVDTRGEVRRITYVTPDAAPMATMQASVTQGQAPLIVQFNSTVSDDNGTPAICWKFGDGGQSTAANPMKTYGNPGVYTATLTAEDLFNSRATDSETIRVFANNNIDLEGQLFDARQSIPEGLAGTIELFQPDGVTPLPVGTRGVLVTGGDGSFDFNFNNIPIYGSSIIARFMAPDFVTRSINIPISSGTATFDGSVYISSIAVTGTVSKEDGSPVAGNDVFLQIANGEAFEPYPIPGGIDFQSPLPPTGVLHGTLTTIIGDYYFPIRTEDAVKSFQVTANFQPNLSGFLSATSLFNTPKAGEVIVDLALTQISGTSDCDDVFPPAPLFPAYSEVQEIFSAHCIGCHGIVNPNAGLSLYEGFSYSSIVEIPSKEFPAKKLIDRTTSGDAVNNSWLLEKLRCSQPSVGALMPPTGKLTGREINIIGEWARRGAPHSAVESAIHASAIDVSSPALVKFRGGARGPNAPFSFSWDFMDGNTANGAAPEHLFVSLEGMTRYDVKMQALDNTRGLFAERFVSIAVTAPPPDPGNIPPVAALPPSFASDLGEAIIFDAAGSYDLDGNIVAYLWDFNYDQKFDIVTTAPTASFTYPAEGIYEVTVYVVDDTNAFSFASSVAFVGVEPTLVSHWYVF